MQVLVWRGAWWDPVQLAIRLWTDSEFTHSGIVAMGHVWEFTRWGFSSTPLHRYPEGYELLDFSGLTEDRASLMIAAMEDLASRSGKYDWGALAWMGLKALAMLCFRPANWPNQNPFHHPDRFFCSEFVAKVCESGGYQHHKTPALVYPADHLRVDWLSRNSDT